MKTRRRNPLAKILAVVVLGTMALGALIWGANDRVRPAAERGAGQPISPTAPPSQTRFDTSFAHGVQFLKRGRPGDARRAFLDAVRVRPDVPEAHVNLGYASLALGLHEAAERAFLKAIDLRPRQVNAYFGLAESLEKRGDLPGALGAMRTYIHLAAADDPFRRRAMSAVWEWESSLSQSRGKEKRKQGRASSNTVGRAAGGAVGGNLTDMPLIGLDGKAKRLGHYGGKAVVLNFWATWCVPCREEMPSLQRLSDRLDPAKYAVIGVSVDDDADFVREFLRDSGVTYPNYLDVRGATAAKRLGVGSYPQTFLIGPDGRLLRRISGRRAWDTMDIESLLAPGSRAAGNG